MSIIPLPGSPSNFISLVTSRIYDNAFIPFDKPHGGRPDLKYTVYKVAEEAPPLVVAAPPKTSIDGIPVTAITAGLTAPLYSLFVDWDVNPNTIDQKAIAKIEYQQWLQQKLGGIDFPLPLPSPIQWALSSHGPIITDEQGNKERVVELLDEKASDLKTTIKAVHTEWKKTYSALGPEELERQLGVYRWVEGEINPITLRASSAADVINGNFVYTSPFYPEEYLVLADDKEGTQKFATEYDVSQPQAYAISLSSGKVYGRRQRGELVSRIENLSQLTQRVTAIQGAFLTGLNDKIKAGQSIQERTLEQEQYGPDTAFGPFQFYLFKEDLTNGQYVYADVTDIADPLKLSSKELMDKVTNFYVATELKETVSDQPELRDKNPALLFSNWDFGTKIGAKTFRILNLVNGVLYDRGQSVPKNYAAALKWYRKAGEQGFALAQFNLGGMYASGDGVAKDPQQAVHWYRKAAEQGYAKAQLNLGRLYDPDGVLQTYYANRGYEWLEERRKLETAN